MTDDAIIEKQNVDLFTNIYLSDLGYAKKFSKNKNYLGELPFAFDPISHKPTKFRKKSKLVQSIANIDENRNKWFSLMSKHDCFPDIYGNYFNKSNYIFIHPLNVHPSINFRKQSIQNILSV